MSVFYRDIDVKISDYKSELSKPLVIFERDRGLEIYFNLVEYAYRFDKNPSYLLKNLVGAYATVTLVNPAGYEIRIDEVEITKDAKVKFVVTDDLTDELTEIGTYQLQIHINNDVEGKDTSVFSIPPFSFEVRERLKGKKSELFDLEGNGLTDKEGYQLVSATSNKIINFSADKINEYLNSIPTIQGKIKDLNSQLDTIENEVEVNFEKLENNKSDIKIELLDTLMCNANFFKLTNNSSYPILQGGCLSDDGLNYYCCLITAGGGNEKSIIQKYSVGNVSDFSTWNHVKSSIELNLSHSNDMQYFNGKIYVCNTNISPTEIIIINPSSLVVENTINIKYGATAITYNKKLNQFITRRKSERGIFDFYDINFNYIKSNEVLGVTYDTVQGIDSDDSYIYEPCSDPSFGNSIVVYDLKGNFIKRIGSNIMSEVEHMTNFNGYYIMGFYKNGSNFLSNATIRTDKRLTGGRFKINQGRNSVLTDSTPIWNGDINLKFSKKYFTHLSFKISVDNVETETKILDITDYVGSHIINTYRLTGTGQIIFYRSLLVLTDDNKLTITPFAFHLINADGSRVVKLYSSEPNYFTQQNSISISNICGQVLCGQRVDE